MKRKIEVWSAFLSSAIIVSVMIAFCEGTFWILKDPSISLRSSVLLILFGSLAYILITLFFSLFVFVFAIKKKTGKNYLQSLSISLPIGIFSALLLIDFIKGGFWQHLLLGAASIVIGFLVSKYLLKVLVNLESFISNNRILALLTGSVGFFIFLISLKANLTWLHWVGIIYGLIIVILSGTVFLRSISGGWISLLGLNIISFSILAVLFSNGLGIYGLVKNKGKHPNIVLISLDTLRPDRLGCYGFKSAETNTIDRLAEEGILFEEVVAPVPLTGPSHISILTGLYPINHGALRNGEKISENAITLPEILAANGYQTAAFVSGFTLKDESCGLASRFYQYDENFNPVKWFPKEVTYSRAMKIALRFMPKIKKNFDRLERKANEVTLAALNWLNNRNDSPFFLFVHYFDPHVPYEPPEAFLRNDNHQDIQINWYKYSAAEREELVQNDDKLNYMIDSYDGEIAFADGELNKLFSGLTELNLIENTIIIFTSDHGESLTEHNYYFNHGSQLYDPSIRVPLIIRFPDMKVAGKRIGKQVRLIDIFPTILEYLKIDFQSMCDGKSLLPLINDDQTLQEARDAFAAVYPIAHSNQAIYAIRTNNHKIIWNSEYWFELTRIPASGELYDLMSDPDEKYNIWDENPAVLAELEEQLINWRGKKIDQNRELEKETIERLRSLGYIR